MTTVAVVQPTGALFDLVLLAHVAAAVAALGTMVTSGVAGARVLSTSGRALSPGLVRYFAPGPNWVGRVVHVVPVLGLALIGLSRGAYGFDDSWVVAGLGLWAVAAGLAEGVLWPAERQVQLLIRVPVAADPGGPAPAAAPRPAPPAGAALHAACLRMCWSAGVIGTLLVTAMVVMVARP